MCARTDTANGPSIAGPRERSGAGRSSLTGAGTWPGLCPLARNALAFIGPSIGSFRSLIIDLLRQVITSSRISSRIRAQGLSHHADRARGNYHRSQRSGPENLVGGNYQPFHASPRTTISTMSPAGGSLATPSSPARCGWPAGQPHPNGKCEYATKNGLDAPVTAPRFRYEPDGVAAPHQAQAQARKTVQKVYPRATSGRTEHPSGPRPSRANTRVN